MAAEPSPSAPAAAYESPAEGNVYASKRELLDWVNGLLQLQLSRLEQFASGAVFCQLLDAYFKDAVPMGRVNFHASSEYEILPNYKVLQQGFTAISLTRDIHVSKLSRGSRVELLELLQYLYKYLLKLKAQEGYNGRERRALTVKGATDTVPLPSWMSASHAAGRASMNRSSDNWAILAEPSQSLRSGLRSSGSYSPAALRLTSRRTSSASAPGSTGSGGSPDRQEDKPAAAQRRPCAPTRLPSASGARTPGKVAGPAPAAGSAAAAADATAAQPATAAAAGRHAQEAAEDEVGVAVFRVVHQEEGEGQEAATRRLAADDPGGTTRLVIPDEAIRSCMARPLSPGGLAQLEACLAAAREAAAVLEKAAANMAAVAAGLAAPSSYGDSFAYRGKVRSLQDAAATAAQHVALLLEDVAAVAANKAGDGSGGSSGGGAEDAAAAAAQLQGGLAAVRAELAAASAAVDAAAAARPLAGQGALNLQLTQLQKQLASTAALDGALRSVGAAYASLTLGARREGAASAARFLQGAAAPAAAAAPGCGSAAPGAAPSKVLKLGDCSMKQLRNGDVYKGRYAGARKAGEGSYFFTNGDVYEGQFHDDRMQGAGVYSFAPEGRYEGEWSGAVYEGAGAETFAKGSTYRGGYAGGARHGWGCCRFFNGDFYEGAWGRGLREGRGMQQCTDDSNYVGDYQRGKRHGYGVYSFPNGDQYLGEYEDDIPQGYGTYLFGSGQRYEGHWDKGRKHGWSVYTVESGQRWAGSWAEGKPQWVHPLPADGAAGAPAGAGGDEEQAAGAEVAGNLGHALAACRNAQEATALAQAKLEGHWAQKGDVQRGLAAALARAQQAADAAQAARRSAQLLAARLDAAAALVDDSSKGGRICLEAAGRG